MQDASLTDSDRRFFTGLILLAVCVIVVFFLPAPALAHKVNVFAYVEGDTVITDSYFNDGRKCQDSLVEVFDEQGNKLLEGKTDSEGRFSFRAPVKANLLIRLSASMGHGAEYRIPADDLPGSLPATANKLPSKETAPAKPVQKRLRAMEKASAKPDGEKSTPQDIGIHQPSLSAAQVEAAVDKALARQLAPVHREMEELRRRERVSDIVGGVGYIIGLMGLAAYFHSRRRKGNG